MKFSSQQALIDAIVAAAKRKDVAAAQAEEMISIVELAGRGLEAPESMAPDEIKAVCRSVIALAVEQTRRSPS